MRMLASTQHSRTGSILRTLVATTAIALALLAAGSIGATQAAAKTGGYDKRFGHDGRVYGPGGTKLALLPGSRYLVGAERSTRDPRLIRLLRYSSKGKPDRKFGRSGVARVRVGPPRSANDLRDIAVLNDGKILVLADVYRSESSYSPYQLALARFNRAGRLDGSFGSHGKVVMPFPVGTEGRAEKLTVLASGELRIAGSSGGQATVIALHGDGRLDMGFGLGGYAQVTLARGSIFRDVDPRPNGGLLASGEGNGDWFHARLTANGAIDPLFGIGGIVLTNVSAPAGPLDRVDVIDDDKLGETEVASGGGFTSLGTGFSGGKSTGVRFVVARFTVNGALDPAFGVGGLLMRRNALLDVEDPAYSIQRDGKIVAALRDGCTTFADQENPKYDEPPLRDRPVLVRFNSDGTPDRSFGGLGRPLLDSDEIRPGPGEFLGSCDDSHYTDVAIQSNGMIVTVGSGALVKRSGVRGKFTIARHRGR